MIISSPFHILKGLTALHKTDKHTMLSGIYLKRLILDHFLPPLLASIPHCLFNCFHSLPAWFLPSLQAVWKGKRKTLLSNFTQERDIFQVLVFSPKILVERDGEEKRRAQQKYGHLSQISINPSPQLKPVCELGQIMGPHILASATSAAVFLSS